MQNLPDLLTHNLNIVVIWRYTLTDSFEVHNIWLILSIFFRSCTFHLLIKTFPYDIIRYLKHAAE